MEIIDAILLGLVQGLTEFIPVSSSGHLILLDEATDVESSFAFDVLLNIGTLLALIVYFWKRLMDLGRRVFKKKDYKLAVNIFYSTLPAVGIGGIFTDVFSDDNVRNLNIVIAMLIIVGVIMILIDMKAKSQKPLDKLNIPDALAIGGAQALALIPGTSRSGATIIAGRLSKLSYKDAAEYSFLIAIPILLGAIVRTLFEPEATDLLTDHTGAVAAGVATAFLSGMVAIHFMLTFLKKQGLKIFGIYRIVLAAGLLLFIS